MKNKRASMSIALICILLGFMISIQFKSVKKNDTAMSIQFQRAEELQAELGLEREKNESLYEQILQYEKDLNKYQTEAAERGGYANALLDQLKRAQILGGLTDVEGQGIIVTMEDSKVKTDRLVGSEESYIIHDEDIRVIINELSGAGAEAISLNDERIISTSEIRCAGPTVSVNNRRYSTPFVIKAIGNADTMESALKMRNGVIEILGVYGIEVSIKKSGNILIPRYSGVLNYKYASPVSSEEKEKEDN